MSKAKSRGLGRGLSALIGEVPDVASSPTSSPISSPNSASPSALTSTSSEAPGDASAGARVLRLGLDQLRPGQFQPRRSFPDQELDELAKSLKQQGIIQPLLVRAVSDGYEILAGERRWRAAQRAGLHDVPVILSTANDQQALEIGIVENVQRSDLNPIEEAQAFARLMDEFDYTQEALASTIGKSRSHVANTLRLMALPPEVRHLVEENKISAGHARALIGVADALAIAQRIIAEGLSVRAVEKLVSGAPSSKAASPKRDVEKDADTRALEKTLADGLGLAVSIDHGEAGGRLAIQYKTLEQLDDVIRRLLEG